MYTNQPDFRSDKLSKPLTKCCCIFDTFGFDNNVIPKITFYDHTSFRNPPDYTVLVLLTHTI